MGLLVLLVVGGGLGWLSSVVFGQVKGRTVLRDLAIGIAGALVGGLIVNTSPLLETISPGTVIAAIIGATTALALAHLVLELSTEH